MDLSKIIPQVKKAASNNSPMILTAIGVTGAVTTAILAGQAGFKAAHVLESERVDQMEAKEIVQKTWRLFVPAAGTGLVTIVCIVMANDISKRRSAALASAYTISQEAFREYRDKVTDKLGEKKEQAVRDDIAQDRVMRNPPSIIIASNANSLCLDSYSGRYFDCDLETIRAAVNSINFQILTEGTASLTDFWDLLGLAKTSESDELGWNTDAQVEVDYSAALMDGKPVLRIEFRRGPISKYYARY